jgi:hypothetical protein
MPNLTCNPNHINEYMSKIRDIDNIIQNYNDLDPVYIAGDLNLIFCPITDAYGGNPTVYSEPVRGWKKMLSKYGLCDSFRHIHPYEQQVSYTRSGLGRRLDYILVPTCDANASIRVAYTSFTFTDHFAAKIDLKLFERKKNNFWRFNDSMVEREEFVSAIQMDCKIRTSKAKESFPDDPIMAFEYFKTLIKSDIITRTKDIRIRDERERIELTEIYENAAEALINNPFDYASQHAACIAKEKLERFQIEENRKLAFNAKVKHFEYNEKPNRYFYNQIRNKNSSSLLG